jgi:superfamily I DNA/RNA helicase
VQYSDALDSVFQKPSSLGPKGATIKSEVGLIRSKIQKYSPAPAKDVLDWARQVLALEVSNEQLGNDILKLFEETTQGSDLRSLDDLLKAVAVSLGDKEQDFREGVASIMTMHQAKGLTATAVIVAAAADRKAQS